jgi:hypothetical protein
VARHNHSPFSSEKTLPQLVLKFGPCQPGSRPIIIVLVPNSKAQHGQIKVWAGPC